LAATLNSVSTLQAIRDGRGRLAEDLINYQCPSNKQTVLHRAVIEKSLLAVEWLFAANQFADGSIRDKQGKTPFDYANSLKSENSKIHQLLLDTSLGEGKYEIVGNSKSQTIANYENAKRRWIERCEVVKKDNEYLCGQCHGVYSYKCKCNGNSGKYSDCQKLNHWYCQGGIVYCQCYCDGHAGYDIFTPNPVEPKEP